MFKRDDGDKHIEAAELHAYTQEELDPQKYQYVVEHIAECASCRSKCDWIKSGLTLVKKAEIPELDALAWHRIERQVRRGLEDAQPSDQGGWFETPRIDWGAYAPAAILAFSVLIAIGIGLRSGPDTAAERQSGQTQIHLQANTVASVATDESSPAEAGSEPGRQWVSKSGRQFRLRGLGLRGAKEVQVGPPVFELQRGELEVLELIKSGDQASALGLQAQGFRATAHSSEFAVRYWADAIELEVGQGEVAVERPENQAAIIKKGQRRSVLLKKPADAPSGEQVKLAPAQPAPAPAPITTPARIQVEAESEVAVIPPQSDEVAMLWGKARRLYYREASREEAMATARRLLNIASKDRSERPKALRLLCEASISSENSEEAIEICEQALSEATIAEVRRSLHRRLGRLYENGLKNCQRAVEHYTKALTFGASSLLDEGTVLGRARCALNLGELTLAESDLKRLLQRGAKLVRGNEVRLLRQELKHRQNKKVRK